MRIDTLSQRADDDLVERDILLAGIPGILWTPTSRRSPSPGLGHDHEPRPLLLLGHPGGLGAMRGRLETRARHALASGFVAAALELPGSGDRDRLPALEEARAALRQALEARRAVDGTIIDRLVLPLVESAVPELQSAMDALLGLPGIGGPVGIAGGNVSIGVRIAAVDSRIAAVGLFAGSYIPRAIFEDARRVTVPAHVLLQWDDEGNDRQAALDLFDALGSSEKTLVANLGGHRGVPAPAGEDAGRFFERHLR